MKKIIAAVLAFLFILPTSLSVSSAAGDANMPETPAFELLTAMTDTDLNATNLIQVGVTIRNIVPDDGLTLIHFLLYYDTSKVEPVLRNDGDTNDAMEDFLAVAPDLQEWRNGALCKLNEEEGYYDISFMTAQESGYAKANDSLIFYIPFRVKNSANGVVEFRIPDDDTTYGVTGSLQQVFGKGYLCISVISGDIPLTSTVSISGIGMPGQTLTANLIGTSPANSDLVYFWYVDNNLIIGNYGNTYTVKTEDVGKTIFVEVYGTNDYTGVMFSNGIEIADQINTAPPAPSLYKKGVSIISLWPYDCCEYKIEGGDWQSSPNFIGLAAGNTYTFYVRYKTPAGNAPASAPFTVKLTKDVAGIIDDVSSPDYGYLCGLPEKLTYAKLKEIMGSAALVFDTDGNELELNQYVGTGMYFFNGTLVPIVIRGDLNGDGKVTTIDALRLKKGIINTFTLSGAYQRAACVSGLAKPNSIDYLRLKKHLLGNYNLYE